MTSKSNFQEKQNPDADFIRSLKKSQVKYSNLTIKSLYDDNEKNLLLKSQKRFSQQINQLETKKAKNRLLRDDQNNNTRVLFSDSKTAKQNRNNINIQIKDLKTKRDADYKERNKLVYNRSKLTDEIKVLKNKNLKKQKIEELKQINKKIYDLHIEAQNIHEEIENLAAQSKEFHENMIVYLKLAEQSKKTANEYHDQYIKISKEIFKVRKNLQDINYKLRKLEY